MLWFHEQSQFGAWDCRWIPVIFPGAEGIIIKHQRTMQMAYLLGIDVSTTGAKALVIDESGRVAADATTEYPLSTPRPLWSEQAPASGGGARSPLWQQIQADIFGNELVLVNVTEGAAYGAALLAGVGAGVYGSVEEAVAQTVSITDRIAPIPANVACYEARYPMYRSLYPALAPSFRALASLP
jgi:xylulokinase